MRRAFNMTGGGKAGCKGGPRRAFTLVEILIVVVILGILASIVIPQFSNASQEARENSMKDDIRYLRVQSQVYKAQHEDRAPGYPGGVTTSTPTEADFVDQMTHFSNEVGVTATAVSSIYKFGPYLNRMPENPINGLATMKMVANGASMPAVDGTTGWIYKADTQEFVPNLVGNDGTGISYAKY